MHWSGKLHCIFKNINFFILIRLYIAIFINKSYGILFNHESPLRGETFVTRKITRSLARMVLGLERCLHLGNMNALRDWGHAKDYVEIQWLMLQQERPADFVVATGRQISVRRFVELAAAELGLSLVWAGEGVEETGTIAAIDEEQQRRLTGRSTPCALRVGDVIVRVDPKYFRPTEVETLVGDPSKAARDLGWAAKITVEELAAEMVREDFLLAQRDAVCKVAGFRSYTHSE